MPPGPVIPELPYADVRAAARWLCNAFGFTERLRIGGHRIQLHVGTGSIVVVEAGTISGVSGSRVMVPVPDVDAHCAKAKAAGANVSSEPTTYPYGERQYSVIDIGGHRWTFTQSVADSDPASWGGELVMSREELKTPACLHFMCGKMAAGKSTLAKAIARQHNAVLLEEDHFLSTLYGDDIRSVADYVKYSSRIRLALASHIVFLLQSGMPVVLDFPGNTINQRRWFRELIDRAGAPHELHYVDVSDEVCKAQLRERSNALPSGSQFTSDAEFDQITTYFQPPSSEEGFNVVAELRT